MYSYCMYNNILSFYIATAVLYLIPFYMLSTNDTTATPSLQSWCWTSPLTTPRTAYAPCSIVPM